MLTSFLILTIIFVRKRSSHCLCTKISQRNWGKWHGAVAQLIVGPCSWKVAGMLWNRESANNAVIFMQCDHSLKQLNCTREMSIKNTNSSSTNQEWPGTCWYTLYAKYQYTRVCQGRQVDIHFGMSEHLLLLAIQVTIRNVTVSSNITSQHKFITIYIYVLLV